MENSGKKWGEYMADIKYVKEGTNELIYQQNGTDYDPDPGKTITINGSTWVITEVIIGAQITCIIKIK